MARLILLALLCLLPSSCVVDTRKVWTNNVQLRSPIMQVSGQLFSG
jgi:hypothetical protein